MVIMPVFQDRSSRYEFDIELAGEVWHLKFSWNAREEAWYMDIQTQNQVDIISGIKMVINYPLLNQYIAYNLPEGNFILWDLEQNPSTGGVTFDNFGKRYQLIFLSNEELTSGEVINGI